jgi:tRNA (cmo5U34)-methyltransferase
MHYSGPIPFVAEAEARLKHYPKDPNKFAFDETVAILFDDMANRSIPGYESIHHQITNTVRRMEIPHYAQAWDFGCSLGRGLEAVRAGLKHSLVSLNGVDTSDAMLAKAKLRLPEARLLKHDLLQGLPAEVKPGSVHVAIFGWVLQFIEDKERREALLRQAYTALAPGGVMFLMEKYDLGGDAEVIAQDSYIAWRQRNGYTLEEIEAKTAALGNSMWPWRLIDAHSWLTGASDKADITLLFKQFNFAAFMFRK